MADRDDEIRRAILARRARFLAAAVAGVSLDACAKPQAAPEVVTVPARSNEDDGEVVDGGAAPALSDPGPRPQVCLTVAHAEPRDAGAEATSDGAAPSIPPLPCLVPPLPDDPPRDAGPAPPAKPLPPGKGAPPAKGPSPAPCLSVAPDPPGAGGKKPLPHPFPMPCLSPRKP